MKKILFLATILLANISCQEQEINTQIGSSVPQSKNLQVVQITNQGEIIPINGTTTRSAVEGELALQFISESDYQSTITEISHMTAKERLAYVGNFTSLQKLADEADMELDEIGEAATSEADFRKKYAQYVEKYSGKLITNKYDAEDLTLYVPDGDKHVTVGSLQPGGKYLSGTLRVWTDNSVSNVKDSVEYNNVYALYENKLGKFKLPRLNNSESYGGDFYIVKTN